jgi:hypothetical protein
MIPKSGHRFSEEIMLKQQAGAGIRRYVIPLWPAEPPKISAQQV